MKVFKPRESTNSGDKVAKKESISLSELEGMPKKQRDALIKEMKAQGRVPTQNAPTRKEIKAAEKDYKKKTQGGFDPGGTVAGISDFFKNRRTTR
jgi:hypothetical protein